MFRKEQIDEANARSIIDYAMKQGFQIRRTGKDYKIEDISGGLYIDIDKNCWHWWGQDKSGGPIQFVMEFENKTWLEAVKTLLNIELSSNIKRELKKEAEERPREFVLPEKNNTMKHMFAYLTKTRGISSHIIQEYVDAGLLYESKERNCIFLGKDEKGEVAYAFVRGTNTKQRFLMEQPLSRKEVSFYKEGNNPRLFVFESAIDMLSYQTLLEKNNCREELKAHFLSLAGVESLALNHYLKHHNNIKKITLCLDNDEIGRKACQRIAHELKEKVMITRHTPKSKDFNSYLTEILENEQEQQLKNEKHLEKELEGEHLI